MTKQKIWCTRLKRRRDEIAMAALSFQNVPQVRTDLDKLLRQLLHELEKDPVGGAVPGFKDLVEQKFLLQGEL
jgi:hypothetical protein